MFDHSMFDSEARATLRSAAHNGHPVEVTDVTGIGWRAELVADTTLGLVSDEGEALRVPIGEVFGACPGIIRARERFSLRMAGPRG